VEGEGESEDTSLMQQQIAELQNAFAHTKERVDSLTRTLGQRMQK